MLAVAHRAGNSVDRLRAALAAGVDVVECDVQPHRGALEMRHHRRLGPWHLWDRGSVVRRRVLAPPQLSETLSAMSASDTDTALMLDLKGRRRDLAPTIAAVVDAADLTGPVLVCTKQWWMLDAFGPDVRRVASAASSGQLAELRRRLASDQQWRRATYGVSVRQALLTPEVVAELQQHVEVVMSWAVDAPVALTRARDLGVDAVISKELELLREVLAER